MLLAHFIQYDDDNAVIDVGTSTLLNDNGSWGIIRSHEGARFHERVEKVEFVSKRDRFSIQPYAELEYNAHKALWERLSPEEKPYIVPLLGKVTRNDTFKFFLMEKFEGNLSELGRPSLQTKRRLCISIIHSLFIILKHNFILPDIMDYNMLYKKNNTAVLADYGVLIDLNPPLTHPTSASANNLYCPYAAWNPYNLPFAEYLTQYHLIRSLAVNSNLTLFKEKLPSIHLALQRLQIFAVGSVLYTLYFSKLPHPTINSSTIKRCPALLKNYKTQSPTPNLLTHCDPFAAFLTRMVHPDPIKRPTTDQIRAFLKLP